jgi:hypothetical protein
MPRPIDSTRILCPEDEDHPHPVDSSARRCHLLVMTEPRRKWQDLQYTEQLRLQLLQHRKLPGDAVTLHPCLPDEYLSLLGIEELAKKKGVEVVQTAVAWSFKRVTAPIPQSANQGCRGSHFRG